MLQVRLPAESSIQFLIKDQRTSAEVDCGNGQKEEQEWLCFVFALV